MSEDVAVSSEETTTFEEETATITLKGDGQITRESIESTDVLDTYVVGLVTVSARLIPSQIRRFFVLTDRLRLSGALSYEPRPPRSVGRKYPPQGRLLTHHFPTGLPTTHKLSLSLSLSLTPQDDVMKNFRVRGEGGREEVVRLFVGCERVRESERESGVETW